MQLDGGRAFLDNFRETVIGLSTGQTGRANQHFAELVNRISSHIDRANSDQRKQALPIVNAILAARERSDSVALVDLLKQKLPQLIKEGEVSPSLLNIDIVQRLKEIEPSSNDPAGSRELVDQLRIVQADFPNARGLSSYFAGPLCQQGNYAAATELLASDDQEDRHSPHSAYLLAITLAGQPQWPRAVELMTLAYAQNSHLRDGFIAIAQRRGELGHWPEALDLASTDEAQHRLSPHGQLALAQLVLRTGEVDHAVHLTEDAYAKDANLCDGHAALGWLLETTPQRNPELALALIDKDADLGRLSPRGMLLSSKYHVWAGRFADGVRLVEMAYQVDPAATGGFGRIAAAALMNGDEAHARRFWQKDRDLHRETTQTRMRYNFIQRPEWQPGNNSVYLYQLYDQLEFDSVLPHLNGLKTLLGDEVYIEVPPSHRARITLAYPNWKIVDGCLFGDRPMPAKIPDDVPRLSLPRMIEMLTPTTNMRHGHVR